MIPRESFLHIQDALREKAERLARSLLNAAPTLNRVHQVTLGEYEAVCEVDVALRTLRLVMVNRKSSR